MMRPQALLQWLHLLRLEHAHFFFFTPCVVNIRVRWECQGDLQTKRLGDLNDFLLYPLVEGFVNGLLLLDRLCIPVVDDDFSSDRSSNMPAIDWWAKLESTLSLGCSICTDRRLLDDFFFYSGAVRLRLVIAKLFCEFDSLIVASIGLTTIWPLVVFFI